jgi:uncharacterized repeat protein (TIGR01451 family)
VIPGTAQHCEAAPSELAPPTSVAAQSAGTVYHTHIRLDGTRQPGSAQIFNNHIPLDPRLDGALSISKTTSLVNVSRGQMVPYTITVSNSFGADLSDVTIVDRFPPGFRYVEGSARIDGVKTEPALIGRELHWPGQTLVTEGRHELKLLMAVGAGVSEGEFTNRAQAMSALTGGVLSEEATATVRLVPDPTFDCTDVTGKVFDDSNRNGHQDGGEEGIAGVRVVTARGLAAKTDTYGRYHITCAITPNEARGSNFVLKLDDRTLPSGFRASAQDQLWRLDPPRRRPRYRRRRVRAGHDRDAPAVAAAHRDAAHGAAKSTVRAAPVLRRRRGRGIARQPPPRYAQRRHHDGLGGDGLLLRAGRRTRNLLAPRGSAGYSQGGGQMNALTKLSCLLLGGFVLAAQQTYASNVDEAPIGEAVERHLSIDTEYQRWAQDPDDVDTEIGDEIETRETLEDALETVKLSGLVPDIQFETGVAQIPETTVESLGAILDRMKDRINVRLHLIGHADNQPLSPRLQAIYGDNTGLSRERAGQVAEHFQTSLVLPPESISFEWAGDTQPVASNETAEGRALNRRVEVEVWYARNSWCRTRSSASRSAAWRPCASCATSKGTRSVPGCRIS